MKSMLMTVLMTMLLIGLCFAGEKEQLHEKKDRVSYSLGYQIGGDFRQQNREIDPDAFLKGMEDALREGAPQIAPDEMHAILRELKKKIITDEKEERVGEVQRRLAEGKAFLEENKKKDGVITLPSGLQYKVIREGHGRKPGPKDSVTVRYTGTLINGKEFGSSERMGGTQTFHVNGVIPGMTEAFQLMKEGANWRIFIPADLGFSKRGPLGYRTVIYDVELISVVPSE